MSSENQSTRRLAAILFADIVGYTSLMQHDEKLALQKIKRYQEILDDSANEYNGQILKNYGDGSLMTFSNSVDALKAARDIQEQARIEPTVPLRIGIHVGEFVVEKGDIYGNGVNLASRIESLGIKGAVLFSKNIYQKIKNLPEFETEDLGSFDFKNVDEPMTVYALANEGFPVPLREEMQGKLKKKPIDKGGNFFQRIWHKKIPHILITYILLAWIGLQIFDWALLQFGISPHWARIFFITVIGITPSLLIYLSNKDRIHQKQLKRSEKILIPSNIILVGILLFFMFKSADLGAISQNITYTNADGREETINVIKEEFQKNIPIFRFDQLNGDSTSAWLSPGLAVAIAFDLAQDKYINAHDKENEDLNTNEKINESKENPGDHYVDGTYKINNGEYLITPKLRNSKNGKLIAEKTFKGSDFFILVDSITVFLQYSVGLSQSQIDESIDLNLQEISTNNLEAFRLMVLSKVDKRIYNLEKAVELDTSFAAALLDLAFHRHVRAETGIETKLNIDQAMRHRNRLPHQLQIAVLTLNHLIDEKWEKAEQLLKMQLEIAPNDPNFNLFLLGSYLMAGQIDKFVEHAKKRFAEQPNFANGKFAMDAALMNGEPDFVIKRIKAFLLLDPQNTNLLSYLAQAYIHKGEYDSASESLEKIILIDPEAEKFLSYLKDAIRYLKSNQNTKRNLSKYLGSFRNSYSGQFGYYHLIKDQYYNRAKNQFGLFMYQSSTNSFVSANPFYVHEKEYLLNKSGNIYATLNKTMSRRGEDKFYTWKQDSIIWNAEDLLRKDQYTLAEAAYDEAIQKNPEHFYLHQAKQHITFFNSLSQEQLQEIYQSKVGKYGEIEIWIENEQLVLKQEGHGRQILLPISDHAFISLGIYSLIFDFEEKNGLVDAYQEYLFNHETKKWEKDEDWYRKKEVLLD